MSIGFNPVNAAAPCDQQAGSRNLGFGCNNQMKNIKQILVNKGAIPDRVNNYFDYLTLVKEEKSIHYLKEKSKGLINKIKRFITIKRIVSNINKNPALEYKPLSLTL